MEWASAKIPAWESSICIVAGKGGTNEPSGYSWFIECNVRLFYKWKKKYALKKKNSKSYDELCLFLVWALFWLAKLKLVSYILRLRAWKCVHRFFLFFKYQLHTRFCGQGWLGQLKIRFYAFLFSHTKYFSHKTSIKAIYRVDLWDTGLRFPHIKT